MVLVTIILLTALLTTSPDHPGKVSTKKATAYLTWASFLEFEVDYILFDRAVKTSLQGLIELSCSKENCT